MESTLSNQEIESIAKQVVEIIGNKSEYKEIIDRVDETCKKKARTLVDGSFLQNEIKWDAITLMEEAFSRHIRSSVDFKRVIDSSISEYFKTDIFKKLSIEKLQNRINNLKRELEEAETELEND